MENLETAIALLEIELKNAAALYRYCEMHGDDGGMDTYEHAEQTLKWAIRDLSDLKAKG